MADLLAKSRMANAAPCPQCKSYIPEGGVICSACGYNTQTGKAAHTRVIAAPKEKKEKIGRAPALSLDPMMGVWLAVLALGALTAGVFVSPEVIFFLYIALYTYNTVLWIWVAVSAFIDQSPGWGVVLLIPGLHIFTGSYYLSTRGARPALRGHFFTGLIFAIVTALLATSFLEDAIKKVDPSAQVSDQAE